MVMLYNFSPLRSVMKSFQFVKSWAFVAAFSVCVGFSPFVAAQEGLLPVGAAVSVDSQLPAEEETHPPLRLTPDKSEILTVDEEVQRVIIGNDVHLNILLDSSKRLIMVPRAPGATHFTLLGADGKIIMQRHAIVASPKENYVRVRSPCRGEGECMPVRVYYCPGLCHEVGIVGEGNATFSGSMPMNAENNDDDSDTTPADDTSNDNDQANEDETSEDE